MASSMERHKCKLCTRTFANGRALGGHMKAHLAILPLPPPTTKLHPLGTDSASSSYSFLVEKQEINNSEIEDKALIYGVQENPKRSLGLAGAYQFSFAVDAAVDSVVIQDGESETESSRNPSRRRSKRTRKSGFLDDQNHNFGVKKLNFKNPTSFVVEPESLPLSLPPTVEPEPVSSVSDTSPEEDIAMCLMMLSRDVRMRNDNNKERDQEQGSNTDNKNGERWKKKMEIIKASKIGGKFRCEKCMELFRSLRAMISHGKICYLNGTELRNNDSERTFQCPYCFRIFGSGQALGGHKRSHLTDSSMKIASAVSSSKHGNSLIDLNLPPPMDEDDFSVLSDA